MFKHISNECSMFFCCGSSAPCYRSNSNNKSSVMTCLQNRRPCPRNHSLRSVWRAFVLHQFSLSERMCKIYMKTNGFRGACPPNHCVRFARVVVPFGWAPSRVPRPLPWPLGHLMAAEGLQHHASIHPCFFLTSHRASSVGGSTMHMKCPDDIGREAGIGRTQNWKELKLFWACL